MKELTTTTGVLLNRLYQKIEHTTHQDPHPGLIIATHHFFEPFPLVNEISLLCLATMDLLIQFVYTSLSGYGKFTICFTMKRSNGEEISFTLGSGIPLTYDDEKLIPKSKVYAHILRDIKKYAEIYDGESIVRLMIRVYMVSKKMDRTALSSEERDSILSEIIEAGLSEIEPISARDIRSSKRSRQPTHITALKKCCTKLKPFMVADTETLLKNDVHKTYAAGLLMVRPGEQINVNMVETYFSEDYSLIYKDFEERCTKVLYDLVDRISTIVRQEQTTITIYFHNFSRFDGILLLKHLACHHKSYKLKPMMRNNKLFEIGVYSDNRLLFRFRDSLNLLPGKLQDLAKNLCPGLGPKGSIPYDEITELNVEIKKNELCEYMKQDILLLGGVMKKAQEIYFKLYNVDIVRKITYSALALTIFRMKYYDSSNWPIHIPNKNEDSFIRSAYYGGHTDVYTPYGEDLYYYDVNSLYPFIMKESPMPGGVPVWHRNLEGKDIDSLFGFIRAYVVCPKTIKRPFLAYRDKNNTLIFPTGEFVSVYYSEELKFARSLGYTVIPIEGYLFEKMESPFKNFVSSLFESRLEARKEGNESLSYVYKILMNSLYGRFGINPKSTITEICDKVQCDHKIRHCEIIFAEELSENKYIVTYHSNTDKGPDYWNPPRNSAVQLAAAITASARIYMYPYISREDCYYTDTDSIVLGSPLPEGDISSTVLGKFKLEDRVRKGYFLAPKSYFYIANDGSEVLKYKGPAKSMVNPEWFESQFKDIYRQTEVKVVSNFRIVWKSLHIKKIETLVNLGITIGTKRKAVFDGDEWKSTDPINIEDLSSLDHIGIKIIKSLRNQIIHLENQIIYEKLSKRERDIAEINKEMNDPMDKRMDSSLQTSLTEDRTLLDKEEPTEVTNPTLDNKTNTEEYPELMKNKDPPSLANGEANCDDPP